MDVYWLEQREADVPQQENWLSANEAALLATMRFPKRRADWLLGRWTAKNAFAICFGYSTELQALRDIEIRAAPSGAPEIFFRNELATATISLSHRAGIGVCVLASSHVLLGCDLEIIEPHSDAFAAEYFTAEEQALAATTSELERPRLLSLLWSGKESALKALGEGLRLDTRSVIVSLPARSSSAPNGWSPLQVSNTNGQTLHGWWSQSGNLLRTMLGAPPPDIPIHVAQEHCVT
jgi:4'-phosphopantetheinyl transferase